MACCTFGTVISAVIGEEYILPDVGSRWQILWILAEVSARVQFELSCIVAGLLAYAGISFVIVMGLFAVVFEAGDVETFCSFTDEDTVGFVGIITSLVDGCPLGAAADADDNDAVTAGKDGEGDEGSDLDTAEEQCFGRSFLVHDWLIDFLVDVPIAAFRQTSGVTLLEPTSAFVTIQLSLQILVIVLAVASVVTVVTGAFFTVIAG